MPLHLGLGHIAGRQLPDLRRVVLQRAVAAVALLFEEGLFTALGVRIQAMPVWATTAAILGTIRSRCAWLGANSRCTGVVGFPGSLF